MTADPEWISVRELARRLGVSADSAYKAARAGQVPGLMRIGKRMIVN